MHQSLSQEKDEWPHGTNQYVNLVSCQPVHKRDNLEIDHERVEGIMIIRDVDTQILLCSCIASYHIERGWCLRAHFNALSKKDPSKRFVYDPS